MSLEHSYEIMPNKLTPPDSEVFLNKEIQKIQKRILAYDKKNKEAGHMYEETLRNKPFAFKKSEIAVITAYAQHKNIAIDNHTNNGLRDVLSKMLYTPINKTENATTTQTQKPTSHLAYLSTQDINTLSRHEGNNRTPDIQSILDILALQQQEETEECIESIQQELREAKSEYAIDVKKIIESIKNNSSIHEITKKILEKYPNLQHKNILPNQRGVDIPGITVNKLDKTHNEEGKEIVAITFDACGQGGHSNGFDSKLINYLIENKIPATLFVTTQWLYSNQEATNVLLKHPELFDLENHGTDHKPLSIHGKSQYGISGTKNLEEIIKEVEINKQVITKLTGRPPKFFRPGTAYTDEYAGSICNNELGQQIVNFTHNADHGAQARPSAITNTFGNIKGGDIVIGHFNHPETDVAQGFINGIEKMKDKIQFVKLDGNIENTIDTRKNTDEKILLTNTSNTPIGQPHSATSSID